ncbi:Uncharacterised protein [uncultured archaeon]|nr:Uncharacterised protein [uncultured archaeon]
MYYKDGGSSIDIKVKAADPVALIASLNGAIKQLRIISNVSRSVKKIAARHGRTAK